MPELPEMETYKLLLQQKILDQTITDIVINRKKSINVSLEYFKDHVLHQKIKNVERRGKYLIFRLQNGSCLLLHLMLGGWMFYGQADNKPNRTVQVQLSFGDHHLYFIGLRLGYLHLLSAEKLKEEIQDIGPEPIDKNFSLDVFLEIIKNRRGTMKTTLLNQRFLAGIGNRYSDEILWNAQLLPERKMNGLKEGDKVRLYESIKFILEQAIQSGGYMDEPLFQGDSQTGGYKNKMYVHDQERKPCKRCRSPILKVEISARNTFYCGNCQH
ncbi:Fpg/Nei family DNA glycosylase [Lederbergia lenta]|uniref:Formamidopyrimidine-DNA glycosylase n=1 Tax=Lederbergia lenta TaxID=1467 RepID=A0A2X4W0D3_LEDLE|nr:DNA-formamidopyrimidine glycosylase family protein [Lederbergia lenta]MEC2324797.1 DNA-formamidopyrimidine glycosylase family protein [Lederbergia lenta]SQI57626.1 Formamidopyrimidine-DNA glycosylase catalytic domain-containing protein [Lederbergia lenta]